jgi:hypothetical protein
VYFWIKTSRLFSVDEVAVGEGVVNEVVVDDAESLDMLGCYPQI